MKEIYIYFFRQRKIRKKHCLYIKKEVLCHFYRVKCKQSLLASEYEKMNAKTDSEKNQTTAPDFYYVLCFTCDDGNVLLRSCFKDKKISGKK